MYQGNFGCSLTNHYRFDRFALRGQTILIFTHKIMTNSEPEPKISPTIFTIDNDT